MVTPIFADYVIWLMSQHGFFAHTILKIVMGHAMPQSVFHPLFMLQFLMPISPAFVAREIGKWASLQVGKSAR
jgi:hypothetical protein